MPITDPFDKEAQKKRKFDPRRERDFPADEPSRAYKVALVISLILLILAGAGWLFLKLDGIEQAKKVFPQDEEAQVVKKAREEAYCFNPSDPNRPLPEGTTMSCDTDQPGQCSPGHKICKKNGSWSSCKPMLLPEPERCCDGLDNDCNGVVDDDCPEVTAEICDGMDNDCDFSVDEGCPCQDEEARECGEQHTGLQLCKKSTWSECLVEICDGVDNNENGQIDEGCYCQPGATMACTVDASGICSAGEVVCMADGNWSERCNPITAPLPEDCSDGLDNDCDGWTDCTDQDCKSDPDCDPPSA